MRSLTFNKKAGDSLKTFNQEEIASNWLGKDPGTKSTKEYLYHIFKLMAYFIEVGLLLSSLFLYIYTSECQWVASLRLIAMNTYNFPNSFS